MTKLLLISAALAGVAAPALAGPVGVPLSFDADGKHFEALRVDTPRGVILTGTDSQRNAFRLEVVGRQVTGFYGGGTVSYSIAKPLVAQQRFAAK